MVDIIRFRDDAATDQQPVGLAELTGGSNATAVRLESNEDARALLPYLAQLTLIEVAFPTFRDGRGYSAARILREAGYLGELRAEGDVLVDQMLSMRRCGFDSFVAQAPVDRATLDATLNRYPNVYQPAADAAVPVWNLRHG